MFHYTAVDARANYLAAQRQEQALRQFHLEGHHPGHSVLHSTHEPYGGRRAYHGHDLLASLHRQIEEEERRKLEEEKRLAVALLLRQAELAIESRRSQEEERARVRLALEREKHLRERLARAIQDYQNEPRVFIREGSPFYEVKQAEEEVALHPFLQSILGHEVKVIPGTLAVPSRESTPEMPAVLRQFVGSGRQDKPQACNCTQPAPAAHISPENIQQALSLLFGGSQSGNQAQLELALAAATQKQTSQASVAAAKTSSCPAVAAHYPESESLQRQFISLLGGNQKVSPSSSKAETAHNAQHAHPEGLQQLLNLFLGGGQQQQSAVSSKTQSAASSATQAPQLSSSQAAPEGLQQILDLFLGNGKPQQQQSAASSTAQAPQPSSSQTAPEGLQQMFDLFVRGGHQQQQQSTASSKAQASQPSSSQGAAPSTYQPHSQGVEQLLNHLFRGQQHAPQPSSSSSKAEQPQLKPATKAPQSATSAEMSLKTELESRLNNEYAAEVRDTIQAILASLADSDPHAAPRPASTPAPTPASADNGKGKGKASGNTSPTTENPTSKDIVDSLNQIHNMEAAFSALESDFSFPSQLDFLASHLTPDTSSSDSVTSHLAHTSHNYPVRSYEQALGSLLSQLDSVASFGNEQLRSKRKHVVNRVEKALEELESEVEGRWRTKVAKEMKSYGVAITGAPPVAGSTEQAGASGVVAVEAILKTEETVKNPTVSPSTPEAAAEMENASEGPAPTAAPAPIPAEVLSETATPTNGTPAAPKEGVTVPSSTNATTVDEPSVPFQAAAETTAIPLGDVPDITANDTNDATMSTSALLAESAATLRPNDEVTGSPESVDTFLLPAHPPSLEDSSVAKKHSRHSEHDGDAGSDWSEIEA